MSPKDETLGPFQCLFLCCVAELGDQAHGLKILEALDEKLGKRVNVGQVYVAGKRLFQDGLVSKKTVLASKRPREVYSLTTHGKVTLEQTIFFWKEIIRLHNAFGEK